MNLRIIMLIAEASSQLDFYKENTGKYDDAEMKNNMNINSDLFITESFGDLKTKAIAEFITDVSMDRPELLESIVRGRGPPLLLSILNFFRKTPFFKPAMRIADKICEKLINKWITQDYLSNLQDISMMLFNRKIIRKELKNSIIEHKRFLGAIITTMYLRNTGTAKSVGGVMGYSCYA